MFGRRYFFSGCHGLLLQTTQSRKILQEMLTDLASGIHANVLLSTTTRSTTTRSILLNCSDQTSSYLAPDAFSHYLQEPSCGAHHAEEPRNCLGQSTLSILSDCVPKP